MTRCSLPPGHFPPCTLPICPLSLLYRFLKNSLCIQRITVWYVVSVPHTFLPLNVSTSIPCVLFVSPRKNPFITSIPLCRFVPPESIKKKKDFVPSGFWRYKIFIFFVDWEARNELYARTRAWGAEAMAPVTTCVAGKRCPHTHGGSGKRLIRDGVRSATIF